MIEDVIEKAMDGNYSYDSIGEYLDQLIPSKESANELFDILDTYDAIPELYIALLKDEMFQYLENNQ